MNTISGNQNRWKVAIVASLAFSLLVLLRVGPDSNNPELMAAFVWLPLAVITWGFGLASMVNSERGRAFSLFAIVLTLMVIAYFLIHQRRERDIASNLPNQSSHPSPAFGPRG
jgi:hypothetical protein